MQAARGLVDLGVELAAGMQRAHDDFERGFVREFRMRIDRDAAAVVGDGDEAVRLELDLDEVGVAGQRLVHGIVDHLGEQVMQRLLVGAADIHAGPAAHRLEPFQHLDVRGGVAGLGRRAARRRGSAAPGAAAALVFARPANRSPVLARLAFCAFAGLELCDFAVFPTACPERLSAYGVLPARVYGAQRRGESFPTGQTMPSGGKTMSGS